MALDFPANPTPGQIYTAPNGTTWTWDGVKWTAVSGGGTFFLPLSGGTLAGPGNLTVRGAALFGPGGTLPTIAGSVTLNLNAGSPPSGFNGNLYIVGADTQSNPFTMDCFSSTPAGGNYIASRRARGTAAAQTAVQTGDLLLAVQTTGYGTSYGVGNAAGIQMQAAETWGATARGTVMYLQTTVLGASTPVNSLTLQGAGATFAGGVGVGSAATAPGNGSLTLNANTVAPPALSAGFTQNLWVVGNNTSHAGLTLDAFGTGDSAVTLWRKADGTAAAPTALLNGDYIGVIYAQGCNAAGSYAVGGSFSILANQAWSAAAQGTAAIIATTPNGTTSTVNSLTLAGNTATFSGTVSIPAGSSLALNSGSTSAGRLSCDGNNTFASIGSATGAFYIQRSDGSTNLLSVNNAGNGTFAGNVTLGGQYLYLNNASGAVNGTGGPLLYGDNGYIILKLGSAASGLVLQPYTGSTILFTVDPSGNMTINGAQATKASGTTWANPSSRNIKQDIQPYEKGLQAVLALNPVTYSFNEASGFPTDDEHIGLVHDETAHMPEMHRTATIGQGDDAREVDALDCSAITFCLINACKELAAQNAALSARLQALESKEI